VEEPGDRHRAAIAETRKGIGAAAAARVAASCSFDASAVAHAAVAAGDRGARRIAGHVRRCGRRVRRGSLGPREPLLHGPLLLLLVVLLVPRIVGRGRGAHRTLVVRQDAHLQDERANKDEAHLPSSARRSYTIEQRWHWCIAQTLQGAPMISTTVVQSSSSVPWP